MERMESVEPDGAGAWVVRTVGRAASTSPPLSAASASSARGPTEWQRVEALALELDLLNWVSPLAHMSHKKKQIC